MKHIVLFTLGKYVFTLSALLTPAAGAALYAYLFFFEFKTAKQRKKLPVIVCTSLLTGALSGYLFHVLLDRGVFTAVGGYNHIVFGIGMFLSPGLHGGGKKAFFGRLDHCAAGYLVFMCLLSFFEEGAGGVLTDSGFRYTGVYGLTRSMPWIFQGCCMIIPVLCSLACYFFPSRFPRSGLALILLTTAAYCCFEPLRDSMTPRVCGSGADVVLAALLASIFLLDALHGKLAGSQLSRGTVFALTAIPPLGVFLSSLLSARIFSAVLFLTTIGLYNPLFPYLKPPARTRTGIRRRFRG